jgi:hypothetical protein
MNKRSINMQSGNMLIYILGAIFLMGFLIVLLRGNFQEGTGIDAEKVSLQVNEARRYAANLERGVNLILTNGISESDLRFAHGDADPAYGDITNTPKRQVFDPQGGGVEYQAPPAGSNDGTAWQFFATTHIPDVGTDTAAQSKAELLAVLPNVTRDFCDQVNRINHQDINLDNDTDLSANGCVYAAGSEFAGTYGAGAGNNTLQTSEITQFPPMELCVKCQSGGFHYYRVLKVR